MIQPGTRLGPFQIVESIGAGGMGEVFRARDTRLGRDVAVKVLPPGLEQDADRRERFEREARTISQLSHPHICTLHDVGVASTEGASVPFWSPDGDWLGFSAEGQLWKVRVDGSGKTLLCAGAEPSTTSGGAAWLADGRIVFNTGRSPLMEVSDRGGDARVLLDLAEGEVDFHAVSALPEGRGFLFVAHQGEDFDNIAVWDGAARRTLLRLPGEWVMDPLYDPSGYVVFGRAFGRAAGIWAAPARGEGGRCTGALHPGTRPGRPRGVAALRDRARRPGLRHGRGARADPGRRRGAGLAGVRRVS